MRNDGLTSSSGLVDMDGVDFSLHCGSCRACCFGIDGAIISDIEANHYDCHEAEEGKWRLDQDENGGCTYLGEKGCTIYEIRPKVCQEFDCRSLILTVSPNILDENVAEGKILEEVVQQGRIRMVQFNKVLDVAAFRKVFLGKDDVEDDPFHNLGG